MDSISLTLGKDLEHCWPSMKHIWTSYKTWNSLVPPQIHQAYWVSRHIPTSHLTAFFLIEILFFKSILWNIFLKGWGKIQEIPLYPLLSSRNKSLGTQLDPLYAPWLLDRAYYFPRIYFLGNQGLTFARPWTWSLRLWPLCLESEMTMWFSRLQVSHGWSGPWLWLWGTLPPALRSDESAHSFLWPEGSVSTPEPLTIGLHCGRPGRPRATSQAPWTWDGQWGGLGLLRRMGSLCLLKTQIYSENLVTAGWPQIGLYEGWGRSSCPSTWCLLFQPWDCPDQRAMGQWLPRPPTWVISGEKGTQNINVFYIILWTLVLGKNASRPSGFKNKKKNAESLRSHLPCLLLHIADE